MKSFRWKAWAGLFSAGVLAYLLAYLLVAAVWAWSTFDAAIARFIPLPDLPLSARQVDILTQVEDPAFATHHGISLGDGQGLVSISGALARDVYLGGNDVDGVAGKLQRLYRRIHDCCKKIDLGRDVMAVVLDARLSKERQLALYASQVYMGTHDGRQLRGLPQAALAYLGKPLAATTDREFIGLAAMIEAPNHYHPARNPAAWSIRVGRVTALVAGTCQASGWFDTQLEGCAN